MSYLLGLVISKSSIYRATIMPERVLINTLKLVLRGLKPIVLIKLAKVLYYIRGDCFSLYKVLFRRQTLPS